MIPRLNPRLLGFLIFLGATTAIFARLEPQGLLLYQEPSSSYTEGIEYRSFQQDNPLYATLVTLAGEKKQLKAAGVVAVLPYPPATFNDVCASTAQQAIAKIEALEQTHPTVRQPLQQAHGKWTRALSSFEQQKANPVATATARTTSPSSLTRGSGVLRDARITSATPERVTFTHASGVTTLPLAQLTAAQVLALNRSTDTIQLPLGIARPGNTRPKAGEPVEGGLTARIGATGRDVVSFCAEKWGVSETIFSTWAFFVVLPVLTLLFLLAWIESARRSKRVTKLPPAR